MTKFDSYGQPQIFESIREFGGPAEYWEVVHANKEEEDGGGHFLNLDSHRDGLFKTVNL